MSNIKYLEEYDIYVSDDGKVFRKRNNELILCATHDAKGYDRVTIKIDGKWKHKMVHRLVAMAFIPNEHNKPLVDHINRNTKDNRVENLRWVTVKENGLNRKDNVIELQEWLQTHDRHINGCEYDKLYRQIKER